MTEVPYILPLESEFASLAAAGGKGANLSILARAGFPVPGGFIITTRAYHQFVTANHLEEQILNALPQGAAMEDPAALEAASDSIRTMFQAACLPEEIEAAVLSAYQQLSQPPVAVRSSATAEDLPEMSFAGQQDTYLNIQGAQALLQAVVNCWNSLWTARAIGYRARNHLLQASLTLAVVVQQMVASQAAGVLFTANPLTGLRSETVIDATLGLGEALVSGKVEPDHYVVRASVAKAEISSKTLGTKKVSIRARAGGGTETMEENALASQALPDVHILALAKLGQQVSALYDHTPQDIEWALAGEKLYLLQSRPITSLYPLPERLPPDELKVMFSLGAVQGMVDPITPLGRDTLCDIFSIGASLFGMRRTIETQGALRTAGERLWADITVLMRNSVGRKVIRVAMELVEPTIGQALDILWDDPHLQPRRNGISLQTIPKLAGFFGPLAFNVILNLVSPHSRRAYIVAKGEKTLQLARQYHAAIQGSRYEKLAHRIDMLPAIAGRYLPHLFVLFVSAVASGMAPFNFLNRLSKSLSKPGSGKSKPGWEDRVLDISRGLPHNPTIEMDLALWEVVKAIRGDADSLALLESRTAAELAALFLQGDLPAPAQAAMHAFLETYGRRGLAEIDIGRGRWNENPTHVFEVLGGYMQIDDEHAPDAVFRRGAQVAQAAVEQLVSDLRATPHGWMKARLARFFAGRARALLGARESPKFFAVRIMGMLREELLKSGQEFVQSGELQQPDDLFYLTVAEIRALAAAEQRSWGAIIASRRENYQRELLRRQVPRLLLSDGRAFYEGIASIKNSAQCIMGSPVSPGSVEGPVRVVLDPRQAGLKPGEIMVCPGTDPSWTPLFLTTAGLVMEVGGMMTHGAVVAREYGIPAVVGVQQATRRLQTGQRIRLNGSSGEIYLLDQEQA